MDAQTPQNIFIIGVSSGLEHAFAQQYLEQGQVVYGIRRRTPDDLLAHPNFHFQSVCGLTRSFLMSKPK